MEIGITRLTLLGACGAPLSTSWAREGHMMARYDSDKTRRAAPPFDVRCTPCAVSGLCVSFVLDHQRRAVLY